MWHYFKCSCGEVYQVTKFGRSLLLTFSKVDAERIKQNQRMMSFTSSIELRILICVISHDSLWSWIFFAVVLLLQNWMNLSSPADPRARKILGLFYFLGLIFHNFRNSIFLLRFWIQVFPNSNTPIRLIIFVIFPKSSLTQNSTNKWIFKLLLSHEAHVKFLQVLHHKNCLIPLISNLLFRGVIRLKKF